MFARYWVIAPSCPPFYVVVNCGVPSFVRRGGRVKVAFSSGGSVVEGVMLNAALWGTSSPFGAFLLLLPMREAASHVELRATCRTLSE